MTSQHRRISRLFVDRDLLPDRVALTDREAHYLGSVLRLRRGDRVLAFNGRGQERYAAVRSLARRHAELQMQERVEALPESKLELTLIQALPKAEAMDLVVQKATELGVHAIVPVATDFSVIKLDAERAERRVEHWSRVAQSACEQCGRHRPTEIRPVTTLEDCLETLPEPAAKLALDAGTGGAFAPTPQSSAAVCLLVGPEGGFSPADLARIRTRGFSMLKLGPRVLRTETAAIAACGLLQHLWGDLR